MHWEAERPEGDFYSKPWEARLLSWEAAMESESLSSCKLLAVLAKDGKPEEMPLVHRWNPGVCH